MSTATNGAATEAAFKATTRATKVAGPADEASNAKIVSGFAANYSNAARALLRT